MYVMTGGINISIALNECVGLQSEDSKWSSGGCMQRRLFTYEEANSLVPWLQNAFDRLNSFMERLETQRGQLADIRRQRQRLNGTFQQHEEIRRLQTELEDIGNDLRRMVDEITEAGIIVRDVSQGLVDFPHMREGREVYLCWIGGEESIGFWHETDRGFTHRQPL